MKAQGLPIDSVPQMTEVGDSPSGRYVYHTPRTGTRRFKYPHGSIASDIAEERNAPWKTLLHRSPLTHILILVSSNWWEGEEDSPFPCILPPYHAWQGWMHSIGADEELRVDFSLRANYGVWGCKPHVTGAISSLPKASWSSKRRQTSLVIKLTAVTL